MTGRRPSWVSGPLSRVALCLTLILLTAVVLLAGGISALAATTTTKGGSTTSTGQSAVTTKAGQATTSTTAAAAKDVELPEKPNLVAAQAAFLINVDDGRVLYELNPDARRAMASTTKIMTGLLGTEKLNLGNTVVASENACNAGESEMWLEVNEKVPVEELLYGLMVMSGNDAAVCVAESIAGSVQKFVDMMNARAKELGLTNTHYANPHGLDANGHYSSARDLATLGAYAMKNPEFAKLVGTAQIAFPWPGHDSKREMANHNKLLGKVSYVTGIKTGYTGNAGYCLVGSGSRGGVNLVSVVLGAETSDLCNQDTVALLEYGFSLYKKQTLVNSGARMADIVVPYQIDQRLPLVAEKQLVRTLYLTDVVSKSIEYDDISPLPVRKGDVLGKVVCSVGDQVIGQVNLVAAEDFDRPTLNDKLSYFWTRFAGWLHSLVT